MSLKNLQNCLRRAFSIVAFSLLIAVSVSAYTLVMRDGRRIEIGSRFVVTHSTLTYEVSPGFQITLQMRAIDIAATERANNEEPGALLRRARVDQTTVTTSDPSPTGKAVRTITNRDLESAMLRRRDSELAYDRRVKELGLPSVEESQQRAAAESAVIQQELKEVRSSKMESEQYWRSRAADLRAELAALDAEIEFVRARIDEYPFPNTAGAVTTVTTGPVITLGDIGDDRRYRRNNGYGRDQYGGYGGRRPVYSGRDDRQNTTGARQSERDRRGRYRNRDGRYPRSGGIGIITGGDIYSGIPTTQGTSTYDYSYERSALITRYNELGAERAGMKARWREFEEEARRAGVPPGWLR